ncbi:MAG: plasmid pRiA4b ORF-3 family protein [Anaerolineae bacterium]
MPAFTNWGLTLCVERDTLDHAARRITTSTSKSTSGAPIYRIKITLEGSKPPIWRRLLVRSDVTLADLHRIIQTAFGWEDYHLHQFVVGDTHYGEPHPDYLDYMDMRDEREVTLGQVAPGEGHRFVYEYDFGDDWRHQVLIEKVRPAEPDQAYPVCIAGRRAGPPEDVGGIWGYGYFLEAIQDPEHEEHTDYLEWIGGEFDPEAFHLEEVNQALAALGWRSPRPGKLPPLYRFILNPYTDVRFSRCPICEQKTHQRKVPLFIDVDPSNAIVLGYTCRYCPDCDLLIAHQDQVEALMANRFAGSDVPIKAYTVMGTVERKAWREGTKQAMSIGDLLEHLHGFKEVLTIEYRPAGWYQADEPDEQ